MTSLSLIQYRDCFSIDNVNFCFLHLFHIKDKGMKKTVFRTNILLLISLYFFAPSLYAQNLFLPRSF